MALETMRISPRAKARPVLVVGPLKGLHVRARMAAINCAGAMCAR
jgi:hypothetical protein